MLYKNSLFCAYHNRIVSSDKYCQVCNCNETLIAIKLTCAIVMKSTKVQTLGEVIVRATTDCTDDVSIAGLGPLNWAIV